MRSQVPNLLLDQGRLVHLCGLPQRPLELQRPPAQFGLELAFGNDIEPDRKPETRSSVVSSSTRQAHVAVLVQSKCLPLCKHKGISCAPRLQAGGRLPCPDNNFGRRPSDPTNTCVVKREYNNPLPYLLTDSQPVQGRFGAVPTSATHRLLLSHRAGHLSRCGVEPARTIRSWKTSEFSRLFPE